MLKFGLVFFNLVWFGQIWISLVKFGFLWSNLVWFGRDWCDLVEFDWVLSVHRQTNKRNNFLILILINSICEFVCCKDKKERKKNYKQIGL